jgi:hypothetical protein
MIKFQIENERIGTKGQGAPPDHPTTKNKPLWQQWSRVTTISDCDAPITRPFKALFLGMV